MSGGDVGYEGRAAKDRLNTTGTNHGSIECINGRWYVFYHRNTNKTAYSRQACAEPIEIQPDGRINQVEITSQGLRGKPLKAVGTFPATICCNLTNGRMPHQGNGIIKKDIPYITCAGGERIVVATSNTMIGYKYFEFQDIKTITVTLRGSGNGILEVRTEQNGNICGRIPIQSSDQWRDDNIAVSIPNGIHALYFRFRGRGKLDFKHFTFSNQED